MSKKKKRADDAPSLAATPVNTAPASGLSPWVARIAIALIVVILFGRATSYGYLIPGEATRMLADTRLTGHEWASAFSAAWEWQPLAWLSIMADFALFDGAQAGGQRFLNLLLHTLNALLVFSVLRRLTSAPLNSAIAAGLFAIHPLRVEPVIWILERRTLLAAFFTLLALRAYAEFAQSEMRRPLWRALTFSAALLAALSHPVGAIVPLLLLLLDVWPLQRAESLAARLAEKAELFLLGLVTIAMAARGAIGPEAAWTNGTLDWGTRLGQSATGLGEALFRTLLPLQLNIFPGLAPSALGGIALLLALAAMLFTRSAALRGGLLWFLIAMLPTLGLLHAEISPWRDSGTYLAHIGLLAGLVWFLAGLDGDKLLGAALCLGVVWFGLAWLRIGDWAVGETLLRSSVQRGGHPLAEYQLGQLLLQTQRIPEAEKLFRATLADRPLHVESKLLLATALTQQNRRGEAEAQLRDVVRVAPGRADGYFALGLLQTTSGQAEEGARNFAEAVKRGLPPEQEAQAENAIGVIHLNQKRYPEAVEHLSRSIKLAPTYASAQANHARALLGLGRTRQAFAHLERARLYTKEASEVVDAWTDVFNQLQKEEGARANQDPPKKK